MYFYFRREGGDWLVSCRPHPKHWVYPVHKWVKEHYTNNVPRWVWGHGYYPGSMIPLAYDLLRHMGASQQEAYQMDFYVARVLRRLNNSPSAAGYCDSIAADELLELAIATGSKYGMPDHVADRLRIMKANFQPQQPKGEAA